MRLLWHVTSSKSAVVTTFVLSGLITGGAITEGRWIRSLKDLLTRAQEEEEEALAVYSDLQVRFIQIQSSPVCLVSRTSLVECLR